MEFGSRMNPEHLAELEETGSSLALLVPKASAT